MEKVRTLQELFTAALNNPSEGEAVTVSKEEGRLLAGEGAGVKEGTTTKANGIWYAYKIFEYAGKRFFWGDDKPGLPIQRGTPYSLEEYAGRQGDGSCLLRTEELAQPSALQKGDILATGEEIMSDSREGGNGSIFVHIERDYWMPIPARIPIALRKKGR